MKKILLTLLIQTILISVFSQDILYRTNGQKIDCYIDSISSELIYLAIKMNNNKAVSSNIATHQVDKIYISGEEFNFKKIEKGININDSLNYFRANKTLLISPTNGYWDGFIITLENDTIRGLIKDRFHARFAYAPDKVEIIKRNGKKESYTPNKINGYSKIGSIDYMAINTSFGRIFAKIEVSGYVTLLRYNSNGNYQMSGPEGYHSPYVSKDYYYLYNVNNKKITSIYRSGFKGQVSEYFNDYTILSLKIKNKELKFNDLIEIVKQYNNWVESSSSSNKIN